MGARLWLFALLLVVAGSARAQADYSLYGVADLSYGRLENSGAIRDNRFNSNSLSASFVGANAKYGFEGGWTVGANVETFLRFQDLTYGRNDSDRFLSRNAFVSLNSDYGLIRVGRMQSSLFETTSRFNAFGNSTGFSPALHQVFLSGGLDSVQGDFYWDRAASYSTPKIEGAQASVMYALGRGDNRGDFVGSTVVYSRGLLGVSFAAQRVHVNNGIDDETDETTWQLGATYNFGFARLYGQATLMNDYGLDVRSRMGSVGTSVPLGQGNILVEVAFTRSTGPAVDRRHTTTSVGYVYNYDSVTDIYVLGSDDRIRNQTRGLSYAVGIRYSFF